MVSEAYKKYLKSDRGKASLKAKKKHIEKAQKSYTKAHGKKSKHISKSKKKLKNLKKEVEGSGSSSSGSTQASADYWGPGVGSSSSGSTQTKPNNELISKPKSKSVHNPSDRSASADYWGPGVGSSSSGSRNSSKPKKESDLSGFKRRLSRVSEFEKKVQKKMQRAESKWRFVPGLKGDSYLSTLGRKTLSFPEKAGLSLFTMPISIGQKLAATGEGLLRKETRKATKEELIGAGKKTPKAMQEQFVTIEKSPITEKYESPVYVGGRKQSFKPTIKTKETTKTKVSFSPQQVINIVSTAGSIYTLGAMKSYQRGHTIKPNTQKVSSQKSFRTPKGMKIKTVEKGTFRNLKGQKLNYKTSSSTYKSTGRGTYKSVIRDAKGNVIKSTSGKIIPKEKFYRVGTEKTSTGFRSNQKFFEKTQFKPNKGLSQTKTEFGAKTRYSPKINKGKTFRVEKSVSNVKTSLGKNYKMASVKRGASFKKDGVSMTKYSVKRVKVPQSKLKSWIDFKKFSKLVKLTKKKPMGSGGFLNKKGSVGISKSRFDPFDPSTRFGGRWGDGKVFNPARSQPLPKISGVVPTSPTAPLVTSPNVFVPFVPFTPNLLKSQTKPNNELISKPKSKSVYNPSDRSASADYWGPGVSAKPGPATTPVYVPDNVVVSDTGTDDTTFSTKSNRDFDDYFHFQNIPVKPSPRVPSSLKIPPLPVFKSKIGGGVGGLFSLGKPKKFRKGKYTPSLRASSFGIKNRKPVKKDFTGLTERPIIKRSKRKY